MKCRVCGNEIADGLAKCGICHFPAMVMVAGDEKEEKKVNEMAQEYRKSRLANTSIKIKVYENEIVDEEIRVKKESYITLANGKDIQNDKIIWYDEEFARLISNPVVTIQITKINGETEEIVSELQNPQIEDFWRLGIKGEEGFEVRIVLGNENKYITSDVISLV